MPQVIVKGISREKTAALAPQIAETVASIIAVRGMDRGRTQ